MNGRHHLILGLGTLAISVVCTQASFAAQDKYTDLPLTQSAPSLHDQNVRAQNLINRGNAAYRARDYAAAVALFTELLGIKTDDPRVFYNRGNAYYKLQDLDHAFKDFSAVLEIDPKFYLALMNRANIHSRLGRYFEAIADYDRAIAIKSDDFLVLFNRGVAYQRLGDIAHALRDLTEAIRLNPKDAQSYANRGAVYIQNAQSNAAREDFAAALMLEPKNEFASRGLSRLDGKTATETSAEARELPVAGAANANPTEIEALLDLIEQSCFSNGERPDELSALAASRAWAPQSQDVLQRAATNDSSVINGWTAVGKFGTAAVIQSKVFVEPLTYVCSITSKFPAPRLEAMFYAAFEKHFQPTAINADAQTATITHRYWLKHTSNCDAKVTVIGSDTDPIVTIRMLHGRKQTDGS